ncbi:MAG TPA: undecaprenyl-diphosphate phosphatase [Candidatus Polarisedimenticolia bacterium]|jgi:undecaprenyl-diphosphatase
MIWIALLLGLIEGLTEFLPVSSTGHLIIASHLLGFTGETASTFGIFIQLGAILAVIWEYRQRLTRVVMGALADRASFGLLSNLALAFLPAAAAGFLLHDFIKESLFGPVTVAAALVAGGVAMLAIEWSSPKAEVADVMRISWRQALGVGLAQTLSLFPGVSRAAATIMGGMVCRLDRRTATEFSFFLAIPTILAATLYDLLKSWSGLARADLPVFTVGLAAAFVSALVAVRGFIRFISRHDFRPFAWYRIGLGLVLLLYFLK